MADRARITSVEALDEFRAALVVYLDKAGRALDEVDDEVKRTRIWLEQEQATHWKHELHKRQKILEIKQQELFSAQIGGLADASAVHRMAVRRAKEAVEAAETKIRNVQRWTREFDTLAGPPARHVEQLRHLLKVDMGRALQFLNESMKTLAEYAEMQAPGASAPQHPLAAGAATDSVGSEPREKESE
jgi:hypothetical protein